jgi:hypothetical protein
MAMIGVRIAALGLVLAVLCPLPQASGFGLRLGPFLFGGRAHHHHRHVVRRPTEAVHPEATPTDVAQNGNDPRLRTRYPEAPHLHYLPPIAMLSKPI